MARVSPWKWSPGDFLRDTDIGLQNFIAQRTAEGGTVYNEFFDECLPLVKEVFARSQDLTRITSNVFVGAPNYVDPARYLTAPPVSRDDLKTLCGGSASVKTEDGAAKVAKVIEEHLDRRRYPWLQQERSPTAQEVMSAQRWTASVWAIEKAKTQRRTAAGKRQEDAVEGLLVRLGFKRSQRDHEVEDTGAPVTNIESVDALRRGTYRRETKVAGSKADVPVRLRDGRLLAIECKESNTAVNSTKRLVRETGGKAGLWRNAFGAQVVTLAVITGVFHVSDLLHAQNEQGVAVVWEHDLTPLQDFLEKAV